MSPITAAFKVEEREKFLHSNECRQSAVAQPSGRRQKQHADDIKASAHSGKSAFLPEYMMEVVLYGVVCFSIEKYFASSVEYFSKVHKSCFCFFKKTRQL